MSNEERKDGFIRLLLRYERRIYAYIRSLVPNPADAEEVLQETSAVLWQKFEQFESGTDFVAWTMQVARHEVQRYRRRQQRDRLRFGDNLVELLAVTAQEDCRQLSELEGALCHCLGKLRPEAQDSSHPPL